LRIAIASLINCNPIFSTKEEILIAAYRQYVLMGTGKLAAGGGLMASVCY